MAHELYFDERLGRHAAFFADQPGWHELGIVVAGARSWKEVRKLAGLEWSVEKRRLFEKRIDDMGQTVYRGVDAWGIFRNDTNAFLGAVGDQYKCIQNDFAFEFVDTLLEAEEGAHYESAGVLRGGQRIWVLARIPGNFEPVPGDVHIPYLLFETSHDGSLAATCRLTEIRVVCNNTLTAAVSMNGNFIKIKHTTEAESRLEAAKKLMGNALLTKQALENKISFLADKMMTKDKFLEVLDRVFPPGKAEREGKISTRRNGILQAITTLFEGNDRNAFPEYRGTAYNILNAITEYTDHHRATRITEGMGSVTKEQARQDSAMFGSGQQLKENALEVIYEVAQTCPDRPSWTVPSSKALLPEPTEEAA